MQPAAVRITRLRRTSSAFVTAADSPNTDAPVLINIKRIKIIS